MKNNSINSNYITEKILLDNFPSPNRFHEMLGTPKESTLAISEQRYIKMRDEINRAFHGSNVYLSDLHWRIILDNAEGYLILSKTLKK